MRASEDAGYTIVEILVALGIFSLVSSAFVGVMMSGARSTDTTRRNVRVSEEARLGLNRIVRDVREAGWISLPSTNPNAVNTSFTVSTDYNGDGVYANSAGAGPAESNYEVVTYAYDDPADAITVTAAGFPTETLIKGVQQVGTTPPLKPVFSFTSNRLEYDWNNDGVTTLLELEQNACVQGNYSKTLDASCNGVLVDKEMANVTNVTIALRVVVDGTDSEYFAEAQLRNRR